MKQLTEEQFDEMFELVPNHIDDNASFDGNMFETYGKEIEFVLEAAKENRVITILEGDDNALFFTSGYHLVNRIGYLITTKPIEEEFEVAIDL
jgi:hypothetical protein